MPIFGRTMPQLQGIRQEAVDKTKAVLQNARNELKSILTPEQEKQMDQIQQRLQLLPALPQANPAPGGGPSARP